ncbi:4-hydroxythreonine-4-phosphate dehydrogenase PdxA, partial [Sulfurovum sp.]|uniref:4-hydroxythreonine-4-phosphate dehydrogenase PdxA n=1 Tax=Sulfurovum sp. TaxID=1969726 RepID=UPI00286819A1
MKNIAISVGDLNGVGIEIALKAHEEVTKLCNPIYCINEELLSQAALLLNTDIPTDFRLNPVDGSFTIEAGLVNANSGKYSYESFMSAIAMCEKKEADAVVTMPIHKEAWMLASLEYKGHTDLLRQHFDRDAIMMLGCEKMYVALVTEHIPLREVTTTITYKKLKPFLLTLHESISKEKIAVLGINPHAGDNGVLGHEDMRINKAIKSANKAVGFEQFYG